MNLRLFESPLWLTLAGSLVVLPTLPLPAQSAPTAALSSSPAQVTPATPSEPVPDRSQAYLHAALAGIQEEQAATLGRSDYAAQAIEEYKKALLTDPNSNALNNSLAELYFRSGRTNEAEQTVQEQLKRSPDDVAAHKLLGRILLRQLSDGRTALAADNNVPDRAIHEFEKILELQPKSVEDLMVLGQLYTVKHDATKAEEEFQKALAIDPDSEEVVLNLARLYAESGDLNKAIKVIETVPEANRSPRMEVALAASYEQQKKTVESIAAYRRALLLEPDDTHIMGALAQALLNDNQLDEALAEFRELADADGESGNAFLHIGEILRRQGKFQDALTAIRKARKKDPNSLEAGYNEGVLLDVLGRYDEAATAFEQMVDQTSHANGAYTVEERNNRSIFLERLGSVYREQNKNDQAIATYQKVIEMGGDSAQGGYRGQIAVYSEAKNYDRAVEVARKAVEACPKEKELKLILADALVDQGKADEAVATVRALVEKNPQDSVAWVGLAQLEVRLRRWKEAEEAVNKATPLTSKKEDRINLLFLRGEATERQKHYEQAEQFFREILTLDPDNTPTLNYMGYMLADKGNRLTEALKMIRRAVELEPLDGAYLDSLGWCYYRLGQYELSEESLLHALERDHADPTIHDHLGDLYEKTGRIRLAAAQWEAALTQFAKTAAVDIEPGDVARVQRKLENARTRLARQESIDGQNKR